MKVLPRINNGNVGGVYQTPLTFPQNLPMLIRDVQPTPSKSQQLTGLFDIL